jgi:hypothetical protein
VRSDYGRPAAVEENSSLQFIFLARTEPLWSILADPEKKGGRWQLPEIFKTGEEEIAGLVLYVKSLQSRSLTEGPSISAAVLEGLQYGRV